MAKVKRHTKKKKKGLGNPVAVAASTPAGQKAISEVVSIIPWLIKAGLIGFAIWYAVGLWTKRFVKAAQNPNYPPANVSDAQAEAKADALYNAMYGPGANFDEVAGQINGLNYNGWIKVFNAFGKRGGVNPFADDMNLVEWLTDQFDDEELIQLRFLVGNVF
ncbi:hypothetical protein [Flavobacterium sp.]|uniref:hypothetical protein n=1 Tax=Flavobacterium sp. TaxID=239 RepID=UPI004033EA3E